MNEEHEHEDTAYANSKIDQRIGSIIESWVNRDTGDYCRFCGVEKVDDVSPAERFCSESCEERFEQVAEARVAIGSRDLEHRGYD